MDYTVTLTEHALDELADAIRYIAADDPQAAVRFRDAVFVTVQGLGPLPYLGPRYEPSRDRRVREILCSPYRIFYRAIDSRKDVEILSVWHGSRMEPIL